MTAILRPARIALLLALAACVSACDFGKVSGPTAPDQSNVAFTKTDLTVGTGTEATAGTTATIAYGAWLYSDTAADHKGMAIDQQPQLSFVIGAKQVIPGVDQGVTGMKVGGTRRVIVPPSMAYGSAGYQTIPPNAALVFDLALTNVATAAQ